jgi:hypothetical protein
MIIQSIEKIENLPSPALGLIGAVHDAEVEMFTGTAILGTAIVTADLPAPQAGQVLQITDGAVTIPAYASWPAQRARVGSYVASDGRLWFRARRYKQTNSFYPEVFERTLYTFAFTAVSLPLRTRWTLARDFDFRLFANNTDAVWNVVFEVGDRAGDTEPAPVGPNLQGYTWREPLIDSQVHITDVVGRHRFEVSLYRDINASGEVWTGHVERYGKRVAALAEQLPLTNDFVLRVRLSCFDTENNVEDPRGFVAYYGMEPQAQ